MKILLIISFVIFNVVSISCEMSVDACENKTVDDTCNNTIQDQCGSLNYVCVEGADGN